MFWVLAVSLAGVAQAADPGTNQVPDLTQMSLEQLMEIEVQTVYSASKFEQKETEAPSIVTVVNSEEIRRYGYRTLADILRSVPGLHVSYDRNYDFLGVGGINLGDFNGRILLLVNGHRVNNNLTDGAYIDTAFILDVDLIDRVEIIQGPGSVLYGNNAFFGVINVVTRPGKDVNGAEVSGEYGEFDTYKARVSYGKMFKQGVQLLLSGSYYDSAGANRLYFPQLNTPTQNNGIAQDRDGDKYESFFGSVGYQDFTVEGAFIHREKVNPTAQYYTMLNDPRLQTTDERSYASLKYAHSFPDIVDVTADAYYDRSDFEIGYPPTVLGTNVYGAFTKEADVGEWWGAELQLNKRLWERHIISFGAEYRDDFRQDRHEFYPDSGVTTSETHRSRQSCGLYAQGEFEVMTNMHLNGGVRFDQYSDFDPTVNPRVALLYDPVETTTMKAIYGTAYRTPNFLELALSPPGKLEPEDITSYELVYEQELGRHLRTSISGFYNRMNDLIVFQNNSFANFDADARGLEMALEGNWVGGIRGRLSYTVQGTRNLSTGGDLPDSPHQLVKFNLSMPVYKQKIFAGVEFQYTSDRHTVYTDPLTGNTLPGTDASGFGVVNLTLSSQNLIKNLEFSASVYNLLDRQYGDPATRFHEENVIPQDGRTFRFKLTYCF